MLDTQRWDMRGITGIVWCCPHMSFLDFGILNPWVCRAETSAGRLSDDSFCCQMRTHNSVKFYVTFFLKQHRTIAHLSLVLTASNLSNWYLFLQADIFPCVLHFNSWSLKCLPVFFPRCSFFFKQRVRRNRLLLYAAKGDLINFRLLLNRRKHHLKNLPLRENDDDSELGVGLTDTTQSPESPGEMTEVGGPA